MFLSELDVKVLYDDKIREGDSMRRLAAARRLAALVAERSTAEKPAEGSGLLRWLCGRSSGRGRPSHQHPRPPPALTPVRKGSGGAKKW